MKVWKFPSTWVGWSMTCWIVPLMLHLVLCMKYSTGLRLPHGEHLMAAIANSTLLRQPLMSPLGAIILRGSVWEMRLQRRQENLTDISVGGKGQKWRRLIGINRQPVQLLRHPSLFSPSIVKETYRDGAVSLLTTGRGIRASWQGVLTLSYPLFLFCFTASLLHLFPHLLLLSHFPAAATSAMRTCLISATDEWPSVLTQKRSAPDGRGWRNTQHEGNETHQHGPCMLRSRLLNLLETFKCMRSGYRLIHRVTK